MFFRDCTQTSALVFADLRFEWILSLCMIFALGAVFAPLFILLGLQKGIVGSMLDKFQHDPLSRLVTPKSQLQDSLDDRWLVSLKQNASVLISSSVPRLLLNVQGVDDQINTIPTSKNDPLLLENGIILPTLKKSVVLSAPLAQATKKKAGDNFTLLLIRSVQQEEKIPLVLHVAGILPPETSEGAKKIWLPDDLFEWIYQWRGGQAVSELGLKGREVFLAPEYDGIITLLKTVPSDAEYWQMIRRGLSFAQLPKPFDLPLAGYAGRSQQARLWKPVNNRVTEQDFKLLSNRHYDMGFQLTTLPYLEDFKVVLKTAQQNNGLAMKLLPMEPRDGQTQAASDEVSMAVWISKDTAFALDTTEEIIFPSEHKELRIPVNIYPSSEVPSGFLAISPDFAGKMNAARHRNVLYDRTQGEFKLLNEKGARYFRAYASSIDKLDKLVELVQQEGIRRGDMALREPNSRIFEVHNIRQLASYMEKLYLLILSVSGFSVFFAIAANVYAGIQRKRRDIAYLELFGLHPVAILLFPFLKSLVLVSGALAAALLCYGFFGYLTDYFFADALGTGVSLTRLAGKEAIKLISIIYSTAALASLLAATAVLRIEPGEYIRE